METHFLAAPSPGSGLSQPPCTIFMKAVEFLMKVNAVQVSSTWSGGVGREVWSPSLGYYQRAGGKLQQAPFLGSENKLWLPQMLSARGSKTTAAQKSKTVARQSIQTKMVVVDTVMSGRRGSWGASAQHCLLWREQPSQKWCRCALLCTFGDEMHYCDASKTPVPLSCFRRLCMSV